VRSADQGESWAPARMVAEGEGHEFEEPAPLLLPSGRILMMLRDNEQRVLHQVHSDDGGLTWSVPLATGITEYPAHLLALADGRIACVAGRRQPPFGIRIFVSENGGESWDVRNPMILRDDLPNKDLGYPTVAARADGTLVVVYYGQDARGLTGIDACTVRL
jgi:hypothetical protein